MGSACTSTTTSSAALPEWLTGPAAETISRSVTESQRPFTPYTGELTAQINPTQQQGIDVIRGSQGNWAAQFGDAQSALGQARQTMGARDSGQRYIDTGATMSGADAASPFLNASSQMSSVGQSMPYLMAGMDQEAGLGAASPFLAAASTSAPSAIPAYMSPYTSSVVDEIGRLGSRNLTENILPNINDTFIGSGQFGSDRNAATVGNAIRDASRDIAGQQSAALQAGYGQAGQLFTSDANRQASLAATAGGLGESAAGRALTGGKAIGDLTATDAARLADIGKTQGDLTNADANRWITAGNSVAGMANADRDAALAASRQAASLSGQQQTQNLTDANALLAAGGTQQQTQQRTNDAAFQEAMRGQNFNQSQLSWLNSIIRGTPAPQTTTTSAQSSPLSTAAGIASIFGSFFKDGGTVKKHDFSPLSAYGRLHLRRGGYLDDEEEDPLLPEEGDDALDETDLSSGPGLPDMAPQLATAVPSPAAGVPKEAPPVSALSILRDRALNRTSDDPALKAAMSGVDEAQKAALERPKRDKSWMDSPLAIAGLNILAAPPGTSGISAIGQGALAAVKSRQSERRMDQTEDQARRMDALKVAQQRLSNILSARTADTSTLGQLARAETLQARGSQPKQTTAMAEAAAMGFDLATPEGRTNYQKWKIGQTRAPQGGTYAPTDIEKWGMILKDPNADPILKDAARRALGAKGNRELTPAQTAQLRGRAAALAQADVAGLGKDFQFKTPEEQQAFLKDRTDKHLAWLNGGADPDEAPALQSPAAAPPPPAPGPAPRPDPGDPLAEATPEELQRIATDPQYPADPTMREAAKAKLAAGAPALAASPAKAAPAPIASPGPRADRVRDVPAPMVNAMSTNAQSIRQIDKALTELKKYPQGVGADIGAYNLLPGPALDRIDPGGTTLRALIADIGSLKIHDRSGAAVTAAEFPRLKPFVPNIYDDDKTVAKKLAQFRSAYMEILADQYGAYGPAAGHKANQRIEDVLGGVATKDEPTAIDRSAKPQEGDTATNPKTGGRKVYRGGKWVDLK